MTVAGYRYQRLEEEDRSRLSRESVGIHWQEPNATSWVTNEAKDSFLIRIRSERQPPHYELYAFKVSGDLYGVYFKEDCDLEIGYSLELIRVWPDQRVREGWVAAIEPSLMIATKVLALGKARDAYVLRPPRRAEDLPEASLQAVFRNLKVSPAATFFITFKGRQ